MKAAAATLIKAMFAENSRYSVRKIADATNIVATNIMYVVQENGT